VDAHHANAISVANQGVLLPKSSNGVNSSGNGEVPLNDDAAANSNRNVSDEIDKVTDALGVRSAHTCSLFHSKSTLK